MNKLYITGDCHGDFQRFTTRNFPQLKGMGRDDYIILAGDFGGVWAGEQADKHKPDRLEAKPFTSSAHSIRLIVVLLIYILSITRL